MGVDVTKLQFYSGYPIDKVVATGTTTIVNDGNTTNTGTNTGSQTAKVTTTTIPNPYGKKCFCRFGWSIDGGVSFNTPDSHLVYGFTITFTDIPVTSSPLQALQAAVSVGVDANNITILTGNGYHGNQSELSSQPNTVGYTPISLTFVIKYSLFEVLPYGG